VRASQAALRAVLFELDGVLFDLRGARRAALRDARTDALRTARGGGATASADAAAALQALDAAALDAAAALPADDAVRAGLALAVAAGSAAAARCDDVALALAAHRFDRALGERLAAGGLTLTDGAREAVEALGARLRLGVVTRLRRADADRLLTAAGLAPAFAVVVAADDRLPAPASRATPGAGFAAAVARLAPRVAGLTADQVAAIVDAPNTAAEVRAAGLRAVTVCAPAWDAGHTAAATAAVADHGGDAHLRLLSLRGLTPAALACALDLAPAPCTRPRA
jgi:beta-phosphoglucomutase-like phosphatase (HAD superfamily)